MDEDDEYGMADLGQYLGRRRSMFPAIHPQQELQLGHGDSPLTASATQQQVQQQPYPYDMLAFPSDNTTAGSGALTNAAAGGFDGGGSGTATARWSRQETVTLLEIRSMLDPKFKDATQKGPLWDEVSRIMSAEHGYERTGKKCREKFENLYKYYRKTKQGKDGAGRQDGKRYRFFSQLEALYGQGCDNPAPALAPESHFIGGSFSHNSRRNNEESFHGPKLSDSSLSCDYDHGISSSDHENKKMGWKHKIAESIDSQMNKLMDKQESWMEKMMKIIEDKEVERMVREEEWRKQDSDRIEEERRFWAGKRAWIEARDAALMDTLSKASRQEWRRARSPIRLVRNLSGIKNHDMSCSDQTMIMD